MDNWYYQTDDRIVGPMTRKELEYLATIGRVKPATMVRCGDTEVWQRMRARKTAATTETAAVASTPVATELSGEPSQPSTKTQPPHPPADKTSPSTDTSTRKQAIAGILLAMVLLLAFWIFRDSFPTMGINGDSDGQNMATNDGDPDSDSTATGESSAETTSQQTTQQSGPTSQAGRVPVPPSNAAAGTARDHQTTATAAGGTETPDSSDLTAAPPVRSAGTVQPGDPLSKFTILAPGEATFFGLSAVGNDFVFVVDRSGSMTGPPLARAKAELLKCIHRMPAHVNVLVLFFDDGVLVDPAGSGKLTPARLESLERWVNTVTTGSGTDPRVGMQYALTQSNQPDAVFLLTDGEFAPSTPSFIRQLNTDGSTIHTVALVSRSGESLLKQIADQNHGDYKFVP